MLPNTNLSVIPPRCHSERSEEPMHSLVSAPSGLGVTLAIRLRSAQSKEQNVQITNHRKEECMMNADPIGNPPLCHWNNGSANNRHDHHSRTISRERPKLSH